MKMRIGHGYDVHRFAETAPDAPATSIRLGGIDIPHARRLLAHSDGDVLIHALCDALLGALGAGDIGRHFPDSDPAYKGIASTRLLEQVWGLARQGGWQLGNADVTVVAQAPRLATHVAAMRHKLAGLLEVAPECVNIKATTTEGLGFAGRQEGIATYAVVLLVQD